MSPVIFLSGGQPGLGPDDVANLQLWFDAAAGVYSDHPGTTPSGDTDEVKTWTDQKNSYDLWNIGGAGTAPLLDIDGANGYPCLTFDAVNDQLYTNDNAADDYLGTSNTMFVVIKYADATPAAAAYVPRFNDGADVFGIYNQAGTQNIRAFNDDGALNFAAIAVGATLAQWRIYTAMNNGTNVYVGVDDTRTASLASAVSGNTAAGANTNLFLKNNAPAIGASIAEVIHYNAAVSEADRKGLEIRLAWKYGITLPY